LKRTLTANGTLRTVNPVFDYGNGAPLVVTDEFIACFPECLSQAEIDRACERYGVRILRPIRGRDNAFVFSAGGEPLAALHKANAFLEDGIAVFAHPNFIAEKKKRFVPNDPYLPYQWHLQSLGQEGALPGHDVEALPAWDLTMGDSNVIIAVIDDGIDLSHEDMQGGKFVPGYDFYDDDDDPSAVPSNDDFHGTAVAGIAAANGNNGIGVSGVAPGCSIMPVRLVGGETSDEQDSNAIRWAAENGAWVISNSWGPPDGNPFITGDEISYPLPDIVRDAIDYAVEKGRDGKGCVITWAAGNGNEPIGFDGYASYPRVIAVGACDDQGVRPYYSDFGPELDVCSSSDGGMTTGIWTTDLMRGGGYNTGSFLTGDEAGNYINDFGGTSAATPLAAGIAALLLSLDPGLTGDEVAERLRNTADRVDFAHAGYGLSGHSIYYGYGRVNAFSALTQRGRFPSLILAAEPGTLRQGGNIALNFSMHAGRVAVVNRGDGYVMFVTPFGAAYYLKGDGKFTVRQTPFARNITAVDCGGRLTPIDLMYATPGLYSVYAVISLRGKNPLLPSSWLHTPAHSTFEITP